MQFFINLKTFTTIDLLVFKWRLWETIANGNRMLILLEKSKAIFFILFMLVKLLGKLHITSGIDNWFIIIFLTKKAPSLTLASTKFKS